MVIKIFVGPKEREYYKKKLALMGWREDEIKPAIVEDVDSRFFDMIQYEPNGIEFVDTDENFNEEDAEEQLAFIRSEIEEDSCEEEE
jgi:hypothetical protein